MTKSSRLAQVVACALLAQMPLAPVASALGPLTAADVQVTRGAPRPNLREATLDYPLTLTNATDAAIDGPLHVQVLSAPAFVDLHNPSGILFPGSSLASQYVTLPTGLAPGQSFTQTIRLKSAERLITPQYAVWQETIPPVDPATAPAPGMTAVPPGTYGAAAIGIRIRTAAGQEWVYDVDATNPNGGTLGFGIEPVASLPPELAGAQFPTGATIEPVTGVLRWTPPAPGLYAFGIRVSDGKANATGYEAYVVDVEDFGQAPLACSPYTTSVSAPGQTVPIDFGFGTSAPANVVSPASRKVRCVPESGTELGEGVHTVRCETADGFAPSGACTFEARVERGYSPVIIIGTAQDYVNLRLDGEGCAFGADAPGMLSFGPCVGAVDGTGQIRVRNTGLGVAHAVTLTIPVPPEANPEAIGIITGSQVVCQRLEDANGVFMQCALGDIPGGGEGYVAVAFTGGAPVDLGNGVVGVKPFSPVSVRVSTSTPELTELDNTITLRPQLTIVGDSIKICNENNFPSGYEGRYRDEWPYEQCVAEASRAWSEYWTEVECRRNQPRSGFVALLGDTCKPQPDWVRYVINGVFAVGTLVTGAGVVATLVYGTAQLSVFNAGIVAASQFPVI
jgi:hypothetical protein